MPYQPIALPEHVSPALVALVKDIIDPFLEEFRFLLTVQKPNQGPKGSLQKPLLMLLVAATDGAAQLLRSKSVGKEPSNGKKFQDFVKTNFPWELDAPEGFNVDEVCDFLWKEVRCPLFHRYNLRINSTDTTEIPKFGRLFTTDDAALTLLEQRVDERPCSDPTFKRTENKTVVLIDSFYWALRIAIVRALDTPEKAQAVVAWIESGKWADKH